MQDRGRRRTVSKSRPGARPPARDSREDGKSWIICILLVVVVLIVFGQTLGHGFINYDDEEYVTDNVHVLNGLNWADIKWAFTTGHTGYSHPITWLSHQFDSQIFGVWAGGHHLTSLVLHAINAVLLFLLFWRMTRELWPSAFIAALFAIHPVHVESVAWVAERKDVLSGFFFLLTLHAYVAYAAKRQLSRYLWALGLFVLGILSKPMLVTLPCLLLLLDYWPLRRLTFPANKNESAGRPGLGWLILEKIPFLAIAIAWSLVTFFLQKETGAVAQAPLALGRRVSNALVSYATYIWNTFWPHDLALFYPYPHTLSSELVLLCAGLLIIVSVLAIVRWRSSPYLPTGWFWFLGMLVPVIGLVQVGEQSRADRYMYLPQIGLSLVITWGAMELFAKWSRGRQALAVAGIVSVIALTALGVLQASYWQGSETIWPHSLAVTSGNHIANNNLGSVLMKNGQPDEAIALLRKAIEIYPDYPEANNNLGYALGSKGNWTEAIVFYRAAMKVRPNYPKAQNNLAIGLSELGKKDEALIQFQEALKMDPSYPDTHYNLAILLHQLGRRDEAITQLREVVRLKPNDKEAREQLGQLEASK